MAIQIATNQHSYSNAAALLSATATAVRDSATTVSITVNWTIYTAGSYIASATRYLVLHIGSASGKKYFSAAMPTTSWSSQTTYTGSYTFAGVQLDAAATSIAVGVGVSASNTAMSESGILVWNGSASVSSSVYDPDIQFGTITGIAQGYTRCTAPSSVTITQADGSHQLTASWSGATGGTNNAIAGYIYWISYDGGATWGAAYHTTATSITWTPATIPENGAAVQVCVQTKGAAGSSWYSGYAYSADLSFKKYTVVHIHNGTEHKPYAAIISNGSKYIRHNLYIHNGTTWVPYYG